MITQKLIIKTKENDSFFQNFYSIKILVTVTSPVEIVWQPMLTIRLFAELISRLEILSADCFMNWVVVPVLVPVAPPFVITVFFVSFSSEIFFDSPLWSSLLKECILFEDEKDVEWLLGKVVSNRVTFVDCKLEAELEWFKLVADMEEVNEIVESFKVSLFWFRISSWYWLKSPIPILWTVFVGVEILEIESSKLEFNIKLELIKLVEQI